MTRYVVRKFAGELESRQSAAVDVFEIEGARGSDAVIKDYEVIGIAYPVHSFNAPKIVIDFVKGLPEADNKDAFVLCTAGEDSPVNSASSDLLIWILRKKGFNVFFEKKFTMPSNFIIKDEAGSVKDKLEMVSAEIPDTANMILNIIPQKNKSGFFVKLLAIIGRIEWPGMRLVRLYSDSKCDGCGACAAKCPNRNIFIKAGRAAFKWNCGLCMRCLYLCPAQAIRFRFPVRFFAFDKWYENDEFKII